MSSAVDRCGTAFGKIILLGEHAVVYGAPALAVGIDRGASARATVLGGHGPSQLHVPGWRVSVSELDDGRDGRDLGRALAVLLRVTREDNSTIGDEALRIEAEVSLPAGGGLGSSAALGVAVARAIDPAADVETIGARAMAWERVFHGNPSGIDAAVAARGGCLLFEKGQSVETVHVKGGLTLCVGHTGVPSSTKAMVDAVARYRFRRPKVVEKVFESVRALVRNAVNAMAAGDRSALGRLMDSNHLLLDGLFVSTPEIETLCAIARSNGAMGTKLTGAGGGGSVVALVNGTYGADKVLEAWAREGFAGFTTHVASSAEPRAYAVGSER